MDLIELLVNLLKIHSITSKEDELKDYIVYLIKDKIKFEVIRNNVVCYNQENCKIALVGHIDTVENINQYNGTIKEDKVYGLGVSDMKSGIAIMLKLLLEFPKLPILWIFYDREEGNYNENGLELVFKKFDDIIKKIEFAIILEPTSNNIEMGCNGVVNYGIWVKGRSGHSARPHSYLNPFYLAIPILEFFKNYKQEEYVFPLEINSKIFNLKYQNNTVITQVKGYNSFKIENTFKNVVPEYCFINLNIRFTPNYQFAEVREKFRRIFEDLKQDVAIEKIEMLDSAPPGRIIINKSLEDFVKWYINKSNYEIVGKQAWTDVARFSLLNIPAINLGPGEPNLAHQQNEYASLSKITNLYLILKDFLANYL